jgi:DNA-binding protein Fis
VGGRRGADDFEKLVVAALPLVVSDVVTRGEGLLYRAVLACVERPLLCHAMELSGGNQLKAARLLGINRNTLRTRLRALGLARRPEGTHSQTVTHASPLLA